MGSSYIDFQINSESRYTDIYRYVHIKFYIYIYILLLNIHLRDHFTRIDKKMPFYLYTSE